MNNLASSISFVVDHASTSSCIRSSVSIPKLFITLLFSNVTRSNVGSSFGGMRQSGSLLLQSTNRSSVSTSGLPIDTGALRLAFFEASDSTGISSIVAHCA